MDSFLEEIKGYATTMKAGSNDRNQQTREQRLGKMAVRTLSLTW